jgi:hypothetical protein
MKRLRLTLTFAYLFRAKIIFSATDYGVFTPDWHGVSTPYLLTFPNLSGRDHAEGV